MAMMLPSESGTFRTCEMKIAATASYSAVPSMLMVAPMGITKRATRGSTPFLSSSAAIATGRVAELVGGHTNISFIVTIMLLVQEILQFCENFKFLALFKFT